jgi:hypothetical protein
MKNQLTMSAALLAAVMMSGCNNAKSPDTVATDTAEAQHKAASAVADAQKDASQDNAKMEAKVDDKSTDLANTEAKGAYNVALAKADGMHDVSLQKCQALDGDAQKKCKDQADADYDTAKAAAKSVEISRTQ